MTKAKQTTKDTKLNRFEIRLSGTGGQGIITLGRIMGYGLSIGHGYNVTQTQSYGPEARGGSSRADLVVSSYNISYPKTETVDLLVALSQEACTSYFGFLKPTGTLLVDTDLVTQPPSNFYLGLPFTQMTLDKIKVPQAMNTVVLGAVTYLLPFAKRAVMRKALENSLPAKLRDINTRAFRLGYTMAQKEFGKNPTAWGCSTEADNGCKDVSVLE